MHQHEPLDESRPHIPIWYILLLILLLMLIPIRAIDSEIPAQNSILQVPSEDLLVNVLEMDNSSYTAYLLGANAEQYLLYDPRECCHLIVPRTTILGLDLNLDVDLRETQRSSDREFMRDRIVFSNGQETRCIILDIASQHVSYTRVGELNRGHAALERIRSIQLADGQLVIPFQPVPS
jgi:hypothetical protein